MKAVLTLSIDVESMYFILMEIVKMIGMNEECKTVCVSICDMVLSSSMTTNLKARMYISISLTTLVSLLFWTVCLPLKNVVQRFFTRSSTLLTSQVCFLVESHIESLEFYYKYLMSQDNKEWEPVIGEYRDVLAVLRTTLLSMPRR